VAYSKKNFKEPLWRSNNVWVRVPKQVSLQFTSKHWQRRSRCDVFRETVPDPGPAKANEWSPTVTSRGGRMSSRLEDADINRLRDDMSATRCMSAFKLAYREIFAKGRGMQTAEISYRWSAASRSGVCTSVFRSADGPCNDNESV